MYESGGISKKFLLILALIFSISLFSCNFSSCNTSLIYVNGGDIWKMDIDGGHKQKLAAGDYPRWRPNFKEILFFRSKVISPVPGDSLSGEIWVMDKDGMNLRQLTDQRSGEFFSFSPDGNWIVFQSYRDGSWQIYKMMADGSNQTRLTNNNSINERPKWSPQGNKIVFQSRPTIGSDIQIFVTDPNGIGQTNLSSQQGGTFRNPVWSPDGKYIAFEGWLNSAPVSWNIYAVDSSGQNFFSLTGLTSGKSYVSPILNYGTSTDNYYIYYRLIGGEPLKGIQRKLWGPDKTLGNVEFLPINNSLSLNFDLNLFFPAFIFYTGEDANGKLFIGRMNYNDGSQIINIGEGYRPYYSIMY